MKDVFRFTPQELRARGAQPDRLVADGGLELRVPYRPPLAWDALLAFLAPRAIPGVEAVDLDAGVYRRTVELDGAPGVIEVWDEPARAGAAPARAPPATRRARAPRRGRAPAVRPRRRPDGRSTATSRATALLRPLVRARTGLRVPGRARPVRGRRARDPRPAGLGGRARPRSRARSSSSSAGRCPGIDALGLTHLFPSAPTLAARRPRRRSGSPTRPGRARQRLRRGGRARRARARPRPRPRRDRRARCARCPASATGPRSTSRCGRAASATRSRPSDLGAPPGARRRSRRPRAEAWRPWRAYGGDALWLGVAGDRSATDHAARSASRGDPPRGVCPGQRQYSSLRSAPGSGTIEDRLLPGSPIARPAPPQPAPSLGEHPDPRSDVLTDVSTCAPDPADTESKSPISRARPRPTSDT